MTAHAPTPNSSSPRGVGWKQSWDQNPPAPGDPDWPTYLEALPAEEERLRALYAASPAAGPVEFKPYSNGYGLVTPVGSPPTEAEPGAADPERIGDLVRAAHGRGHDTPDAGSEVERVLPPPADPMAVARVLAARHVHDDTLTLRHWRGGWWTWRGSHWVELEVSAVRKEAYVFTEHASYEGKDGLEPWAPTRYRVGNLMEALAAITHLDETTDQPAWIDGDSLGDIVAVTNGLLHLDRRVLLPHTPRYFNQTAVPFRYEPEAPPPERWLRFPAELWPEDLDSIKALQEFFGYVISSRLDLHKILLIVGPTRGGKGTLARILGKLIGPRNVAGPTLSSLSYDFGLAPLLGRPLAVISDARLDASRDSTVVVERLLAISGEDTITVNRKYREQWTGKLPTRFLVISNELPRLGDASATIANRFVVLLLQRSWLGQEDHALEAALTDELSGILNWSLVGLDRLGAQDRFTRPASTDEAIITLQDLASPVAAFVRDECRTTGPSCEVAIEDIYKRWKEWAEVNGNRSGSVHRFGRDLRAVVPALRVVQPRVGDARSRRYRGIALREPVDPPDPPDLGTRWHAHQSTVGATADGRPASTSRNGDTRVPSRATSVGAAARDGLARAGTRTVPLSTPDTFDPETATDDDADAPICECGHRKVATPTGRWVCTNGPGHGRGAAA